MKRRQFFAGGVALVAIYAVGCLPVNTMLNAMQKVLKSVEDALLKLGPIGGLLPPIVHEVRGYLLQVTEFIDAAGVIIENDSINAISKAAQILALGTKIVLPVIANTQISAILVTVDAALKLFLAFFSPGRNYKEAVLNDYDHRYLVTIESEASTDGLAVRDWARTAAA